MIWSMTSMRIAGSDVLGEEKNAIGSLYIPLPVFLGFVINACRRNKSFSHSVILATLMEEPLTLWRGISLWCCCKSVVVCLQSAHWCCSHPLPSLHWSRSAGRIVGKLISPSGTHTHPNNTASRLYNFSYLFLFSVLTSILVAALNMIYLFIRC